MERITFRDADGRTFWFDLDAATETIEEDTRWNGRNMVSVHTVDPFDHQRLIRTAGGRWVLETSSQWDGKQDEYRFLTDDEARDWLILNKSDDILGRYFGTLEEESGPDRGGRPPIGGKLPPTDVGDDMLKWLDATAAVKGMTRAARVRELLEAAREAESRQGSR